MLAVPSSVLAGVAVEKDRGIATLAKQLLDIRRRGEYSPDFVALADQFSESSVQDVSQPRGHLDKLNQNQLTRT